MDFLKGSKSKIKKKPFFFGGGGGKEVLELVIFSICTKNLNQRKNIFIVVVVFWVCGGVGGG